MDALHRAHCRDACGVAADLCLCERLFSLVFSILWQSWLITEDAQVQLWHVPLAVAIGILAIGVGKIRKADAASILDADA